MKKTTKLFESFFINISAENWPLKLKPSMQATIISELRPIAGNNVHFVHRRLTME